MNRGKPVAAARAAGQGPRAVEIDGECESPHEADAWSVVSRGWCKEAEARYDPAD